jgi:hypothetical protein
LYCPWFSDVEYVEFAMPIRDGVSRGSPLRLLIISAIKDACTPIKYPLIRYMPIRCTPIRHSPIGCTPVRCTPIRYTPVKWWAVLRIALESRVIKSGEEVGLVL